MSKLILLSWKKLIRKLRHFGFEGPYAGGKHLYMVKGDIVLTVPNPHKCDVSKDLISRIIRQAGISHEEWG